MRIDFYENSTGPDKVVIYLFNNEQIWVDLYLSFQTNYIQYQIDQPFTIVVCSLQALKTVPGMEYQEIDIPLTNRVDCINYFNSTTIKMKDFQLLGLDSDHPNCSSFNLEQRKFYQYGWYSNNYSDLSFNSTLQNYLMINESCLEIKDFKGLGDQFKLFVEQSANYANQTAVARKVFNFCRSYFKPIQQDRYQKYVQRDYRKTFVIPIQDFYNYVEIINYCSQNTVSLVTQYQIGGQMMDERKGDQNLEISTESYKGQTLNITKFFTFDQLRNENFIAKAEILICGNESLKSNIKKEVVLEIKGNKNNQSLPDIDLSSINLESTIFQCPFTSDFYVNKTEDIDKILWVEYKSIMINPLKVAKDKYQFKVCQNTSSDVVGCFDVDLKIKFILNQMPKFKDDPVTKMVVFVNASDPNQPKKVQFTSPQIIDIERNKIMVEIDDKQVSNFCSVQYIEESNTIIFEVSTAKLNKSESYTIPITLSDDGYGPIHPTKYTFTIAVEYIAPNIPNSSKQTNDENKKQKSLQKFQKNPFLGKNQEALDKLKQTLNNEEEEKEVKSPQVDLKMGNRDGSFYLVFSEEMLAPQNISEINYTSLFDIQIISVYDKQIYKPSSKSSRQLDQLDPFSQEQSKEQDLSFQYHVALHNATHIQIVLEFNNPNDLSTSGFGKDSVQIRFKDLSQFVSLETGLTLQVSDFKSGVQQFKVQIPPIDKSPERTNQIKNSGTTVTSSAQFIGQSNLFISLILKASKKQLWTMIRSFQLLILSSIINVDLPQNFGSFLKQISSLGSTDPIQFQEQELESSSLSKRFEEGGFESLNLFQTSKSYAAWLIIIILKPIFISFLNKICLYFRKYSLMRQIGTSLMTDKSQTNEIAGGILRMSMETYFKITMCTFISQQALMDSIRKGTFTKNLEGQINTIHFLLTLIFLLLTTGFPIWIFIVIRRNFSSLKEMDIEDRYGAIYSEFRKESVVSSQYQAIFLGRRYIFVLIAVVLTDQPFFQVTLNLCLSFFSLMYLSVSQPFIDQNQNRIEIFNEFCVFLFVFIMTSFLNPVYEQDFREMMGYGVIGLVCLNVGINLVIVGYSTVSLLYRTGFEIFTVIRDNIETQRLVENKQLFAQRYPKFAHMYQDISQEFEARKYCFEWVKQRKWLLKNGVKVEEMEEEKKFKELKECFNFTKKAIHMRLLKGQILAAQKLADQKNQQNIDRKVKIRTTKEMRKMFGRLQRVRIHAKSKNTLDEIKECEEEDISFNDSQKQEINSDKEEKKEVNQDEDDFVSVQEKLVYIQFSKLFGGINPVSKQLIPTWLQSDRSMLDKLKTHMEDEENKMNYRDHYSQLEELEKDKQRLSEEIQFSDMTDALTRVDPKGTKIRLIDMVDKDTLDVLLTEEDGCPDEEQLAGQISKAMQWSKEEVIRQGMDQECTVQLLSHKKEGVVVACLLQFLIEVPQFRLFLLHSHYEFEQSNADFSKCQVLRTTKDIFFKALIQPIEGNMMGLRSKVEVDSILDLLKTKSSHLEGAMGSVRVLERLLRRLKYEVEHSDLKKAMSENKEWLDFKELFEFRVEIQRDHVEGRSICKHTEVDFYTSLEFKDIQRNLEKTLKLNMKQKAENGTCPKCKKNLQLTVTTFLSNLPPILAITLRRNKNDKFKLQEEVIDMAGFRLPGKKGKGKYRVLGVLFKDDSDNYGCLLRKRGNRENEYWYVYEPWKQRMERVEYRDLDVIGGGGEDLILLERQE